MVEPEQLDLGNLGDDGSLLLETEPDVEVMNGSKTSGNIMNKFRTRLSRSSKRDISSNTTTDDESGLKRELNLFSAVAYVVGNIIGSGIFITPQTVLCRTGSFGASLVVWVVGGIVAMAGGLCYIELGLLIGKSGAEYNFIKEAYTFKKYRIVRHLGSVLSFLFVWCSVIIIRSSSLAIITLTCAEYLIRPFYAGCPSNSIPQSAVKLTSLVIITILALVNCYSLKLASKVMSFLSVTKVLAIVFIVAIGLVFIVKERSFPSSFTNPFQVLPGRNPTLPSIGLSLYGVLWAYDGWNVACYGVEETKNATRTLPLSVFLGIPIVMICYLLTNISFFAVLEYNEVLDSDTVALPFGSATIGRAGLIIIPLLVSVSTFGSANGTIFSGSRITFVAAREGHLPEFLCGTHATAKTPIPAILLQVFLAMLMVAAVTISQLIDGFTFTIFIFYTMSILAVIILRITQRDKPRYFKIWFIVPVAVVMTCFSVFVVFAPLLAAPIPPLIALGFLLLGLPVYIFLVVDRLRPKVLDRLSGFINQTVNNLFNTQSTRHRKLN